MAAYRRTQRSSLQLGLRVGGHLALAQMNHSELSRMAGAVDDSTINIVEVIIIITIIIQFSSRKKTTYLDLALRRIANR